MCVCVCVCVGGGGEEEWALNARRCLTKVTTGFHVRFAKRQIGA